MKPMQELNAEERELLYRIFDQQLAIRNQNGGFKTKKGLIRNDLDSSEFTMLDANATKVVFKHKVTENRIYLVRVIVDDNNDWNMFVPEKNYSFNNGHFDKD